MHDNIRERLTIITLYEMYRITHLQYIQSLPHVTFSQGYQTLHTITGTFDTAQNTLSKLKHTFIVISLYICDWILEN